MNKLYIKIREERQSKNLSQKELAKDLGVSEKTISHYEKGYSEPSLNMLIKISNYFCVTVDYLLGLED